ncbi:MAG TPA: glycosyltransferase family 2 protein [Thermoanaerobaculia bacterium]|nr:glycosyltransferase family 2 protein [Thermoanaerobaculia bacterium]
MRSAPANDLRVAAIVPAFNEEATLTEVLSVLKATPGIDEILVVSDGSTDGTVEIARSLGLRTIHLRENQGKGRAMAIGVAHTDAPILLFVDGDILNLTEDLLTRLIEPVVSGRSDMNVGIRHRGAVIDAFHRRTGPLLSGVRCLKRGIFEAVPESHLEGFAIETGLNWACRESGCRTTTTVMYNLKHLVKEKKRGLVEGSRARYRMFAAVFGAWMSLKLNPPALRQASTNRLFQPELEYINF